MGLKEIGMSQKRTKSTNSTRAERVDAEFEPAPCETVETVIEEKPKSGLAWLKISGFCVLAALIGGASGYGLGRVWPASETVDVSPIEARLAALEAIEIPDLNLSPVEAQIRSLETASGLRGQALEELIARINALETTQDNGADSITEPVDLSPIEARLDTLETDLRAAQNDALMARSALDQLQASLLAQSDAAEGAVSSVDTEVLSVLRGEVAALEARIDSLADDVAAIEDFDPTVLQPMQTELDRLAQSFAALDVEANLAQPEPSSGPVMSSPERALAFAQLARQASGTGPFVVELAELLRVWPDAPGAQSLVPIAADGAPDGPELIAAFPEMELRQLTGETQLIFGVVRIDRADVYGPAAQIKSALTDHDFGQVAELVDDLTAEQSAALEGWVSLLQSRLNVVEGLDRMSVALNPGEEVQQ
jgi:hypothetical protein